MSRYYELIASAREMDYVSKYDKFIIEMTFRGKPKETFWLTAKQWKALEGLFDRYTDGTYYSNKAAMVYGCFELTEKGRRFMLAASNKDGRDFLAKSFGAVDLYAESEEE